jgi:hypothetical protein
MFVCPACDTRSPSPQDRQAGYCARCHWYTGDPTIAWTRPELFTVHGRPAPPPPDGYVLDDALFPVA